MKTGRIRISVYFRRGKRVCALCGQTGTGGREEWEAVMYRSREELRKRNAVGP